MFSAVRDVRDLPLLGCQFGVRFLAVFEQGNSDCASGRSGHVKQRGGGSHDEARLEQTPYPYNQLIWRYLGIK